MKGWGGSEGNGPPGNDRARLDAGSPLVPHPALHSVLCKPLRRGPRRATAGCLVRRRLEPFCGGVRLVPCAGQSNPKGTLTRATS